MSTQASPAHPARPSPRTWALPARLRVTRRGIQIALGCIWLLDGLLQFQSYMYTHAFLAEVIEPTAKGQPGLIGHPILTMAHFYGHDMTLWNTLSAEVQCAIGLGLIVSRRTVRPALAVSYVWAFVVWWLGEGFATLFSGAPVSPLMGAPGAVIVYGLIGLLVWPRDHENPDGAPVAGGLLGPWGGRVVWTLIWVEAAVLWMLHVDRTREALKEQIAGMAEASPHWLASVQHSLANGLGGDGVTAATVLAVASVAIAAGVWTRLCPAALVGGAALSVAYWVYGQSLGGPFWIGQATDVNTGPLLVLLAVALMPLARPAAQEVAARERARALAPVVGPAAQEVMAREQATAWSRRKRRELRTHSPGSPRLVQLAGQGGLVTHASRVTELLTSSASRGLRWRKDAS